MDSVTRKRQAPTGLYKCEAQILCLEFTRMPVETLGASFNILEMLARNLVEMIGSFRGRHLVLSLKYFIAQKIL